MAKKKSPLPQPLLNVVQRIDAMALRERLLLLVTVVCLMGTAWYRGPIASLETERARLHREVDQLHGEIGTLHDQVGTALTQRAADPDVDNRRRLQVLRVRQSAVGKQLNAVTDRLVPPERMPELIESLLRPRPGASGGLELLRLEGLGVEELWAPEGAGDSGPGDAGAGDLSAERGVAGAAASLVVGELAAAGAGPGGLRGGAGLYRHGVRVTLRGEYLATLQYLRDLEALPWNFLWEAVEFDVEQYPRARVSITVYSLSFERDWIGV